MSDMRHQRLRNGAVTWALTGGTDDHSFTESYGFASWRDRVRHHERTTKSDVSLEDQARALQVAGKPPAVRHLPFVLPPGPLSKERLRCQLDHCFDRMTSETDRLFDRLALARERDTLHRPRGAAETLEEGTMLIRIPVIREKR